MGKYYTAGVTTKMTLKELAEKAAEAYGNKESFAANAWYAAESTMINSYKSIDIFGDGVKKRYEAGIKAAAKDKRFRFDKDKWTSNWINAMSR